MPKALEVISNNVSTPLTQKEQCLVKSKFNTDCKQNIDKRRKITNLPVLLLVKLSFPVYSKD